MSIPRLAVGDLVVVAGVGEGTITGFTRVDSYRYGSRHLVVVRFPDGRRFELPPSSITVAEPVEQRS